MKQPNSFVPLSALRLLSLLFLPLAINSQSRGYDWDDVHFENASATLAEGFPMLTRLAQLLRNHQDYKVVLTGNTAAEGSTSASDEKLGLARAEAVKTWLVQAGASPAQIEARSDGRQNRIAANDTSEGRFRNRRVAIVVFSANGTSVGDGSSQAAAINDFENYMRAQMGKLDSVQSQLQELASQNQGLRAEVGLTRAELEKSRSELEAFRAQMQLPSLRPPPETQAWRGGIVGRRFLVGAAGEDKGYGLYSYLLIPRIPAESEQDLRKRYIAAIDAFLTITQIETIRGWRQPDAPPDKKLNITYFPLMQAPAKGSDSTQLLRALNDGRSRQFIGVLGQKHAVTGRDGPFIVSSEKPLSAAGPLGQHLYFDMTGAPPDVVKLYVTAFEIQSEREQFWARGKEIWLTEFYDFIERGGAAMDDVQKAFTKKQMLSMVLTWVK